MSEIRVKVLLTNAIDESLHRRRKLKKSAVRRYESDALVDTGAVRSIIPVQVMEKLNEDSHSSSSICVYSSNPPSRFETNVTARPSGRQVGRVSRSGWRDRFQGLAPSAAAM